MGSKGVDVCRLCAGKLEEGAGECIFSSERSSLGSSGGRGRASKVKQSLEASIKRYLRLEVRPGDDLPQRVCSHCCSVLDYFHKFAEACLRAQDKIFSRQVTLRMKAIEKDNAENAREKEMQEGQRHSDGVEDIDDFCVQNSLELEWGDSPPEQPDSENKKASSSTLVDKEVSPRRRSRKQSKPVRTVVTEDDASEGAIPIKRRMRKKRTVVRYEISSSENEDAEPSKDAAGGEEDKETFQVACLSCGVEFSKWTALTQHYQELHATRLVQGKCICGVTLNGRAQMYRHRRKHLKMFRYSMNNGRSMVKSKMASNLSANSEI